MKTLQSYILGSWQAGDGELRTLFDPTTEEAVAQCPSAGVDYGAVLQHARSVGGPALRAMDFQARGKMLKALSAAIYAQREELLDLSVATAGTTRGDAKFDIDGATGTLASYAHFAKQLGEKSFHADGEGTQLGRTARFWGQHISAPKLGAAVHINAFNFPAWNMCEKMACALLAGMPVLEKPGTPTALVAHRLAEVIVESGVLPEGAFQFVVSSPGDLLDHMGPQDALAFTGSSGTGKLLRGHPSVVEHNIHVNIEADSLNAAVLGPDVDADSETYGLFLSNLRTDMTQKSGQKCTAVRRIFVPAERIDEVAADLMGELSRVKQGNPSESDVRMGPLVSKSALQKVRAGISALAAAGKILCGGVEPVFEKGFFVAPTLIQASDAEAAVFHNLEVFGPVASLIPYSGSVEDAVRLVNLGGGGLVASLYADDRKWSEALILGISPWHGRVWWASEKVAEQALAPGMVLPASVHGGPGRAGGGLELGGLRGLEGYLQRTAIQGFQGFVAAAFGAPVA